MDQPEHEDIVWLHTKLSGHANDLSTVYERIAFAIQRMHSEKVELQTRIDQLEQDNPSADVRRLRDENSMLRARLATTTRENAEVTRERDALFRKLYGIKQLIDDPPFDERDISTDAQNAVPVSRSTTSTVRPQHDRHIPAIVQRSTSAAENASPIHTDVSEPKTDVTTLHDSFGRVIRPHPPIPLPPHGATFSTNEPTWSTQPLSTHTTATLIESQPGTQDAAETRGGALGAPFVVETHEPASPSLPQSAPAVLRPLHLDMPGSPMRGSNGVSRVLSLNSSPGISEGLSGLSLQYDALPRRASGPADAVTTVQKWRIHFAKPPSSATAFALPKPVTTATLVQNLELDEDTRRSIEGLSSEPADSLRLYIYDPFGLAFLYDPVLLESSEATYVVEWSEVTASQNSKAYITTAKEKHSELHTFIYAPRKNGWHYLGQQRWSLVDIKSIWTSLGSPAQRALATRSFQSADPSEITRRLKRGQIEQLTIELQQVSLVQPNPGESILVKKLRDSGQV